MLKQWVMTHFPIFYRFIVQPILLITVVPLIFFYIFAPQFFDSRTHGNVTFGYTVHCHEHNDEHYPSEGWVWTKGTEGVVTWEEPVYGHIRTIYGEWSAIYNDYYIGATNFMGLKLRVDPNNFIMIGFASHVALGSNYP